MCHRDSQTLPELLSASNGRHCYFVCASFEGSDTSVFEVWYWNRLHTLSSGSSEATCVTATITTVAARWSARCSGSKVNGSICWWTAEVLLVCVCVYVFIQSSCVKDTFITFCNTGNARWWRRIYTNAFGMWKIIYIYLKSEWQIWDFSDLNVKLHRF